MILPTFSWNDLATLQVSIQSLPSSGDVPAVYLDSVWINVDYIALSPSPSVPLSILTTASTTPIGLLSAGQSERTNAMMHFAGRDFASGLVMNNVNVTSVSGSYGQHGIVVRAGTVSGISPDDIRQGWVSWSFVPSSIDAHDASAVQHYVFGHYFGFTNDPSDVLLDDGTVIPDTPSRIAIFSWICKTDSCDTESDISPIQFLSQKAFNYHRIATGTRVFLSAYH